MLVVSHESGAERKNHTSSGAAPCMLPFHVQVFHEYPQDLLDRAALSPLLTQSLLILVIVPTQVQALALCLEL